MFPRRFKRIWIGLLAASPLAYWAGTLIQRSALRDMDVRLEIDRDRAFSIAREFAQKEGWVTDGWRETLKLETDRTVYRYLREHPGAGREAVEAVTSPAMLQVRLRSSGTKDSLRVWMDLKGKIYGFRGEVDESDLDTKTGGDKPEQAQMIAEAALKARFPNPVAFEISKPDISTLNREGSRITHRYLWRIKIPSLSELDLRYQVDIRGGRILRDKVDPNPSATLRQQSPKGMRLHFLKGLFGFEVVFLTIFVLIRY